MTYSKNTWVDGEDGETPINAAALSHIETGIETAQQTADAAVSALSTKVTATSLAAVATSGSYTDLLNKPAPAGIADATTSTRGVIQLAGDLAGTAAAPTVPGLAAKADASAVSTALAAKADASTVSALSSAAVKTVAGLSASTTAGAANAALIQTAINAAFTAGGGAVLVPRGLWYVAPLVLKSRVRLVGEGRGTTLKLAAGTNTHMVTVEQTTRQVALEDMVLDGNKINQTAGNILHLDQSSYPAPDYVNDPQALLNSDPIHYFGNLLLVDAKDNGVRVIGVRGGSQFRSVFVYAAGAAGFSVEGPDCHFDHCVTADTGTYGFYVGPNGASSRLLGCKTFLAGKSDATKGNGYLLEFTSGVHLVHCEAQDNRGHGFAVFGCVDVMITGRADRNGLGPEPVVGNAGDGIFIGQTTRSTFHVTTGDRGSSDGTNPGAMLQGRGYNLGSSNDHNVYSFIVGYNKSGQAGVGTPGANDVLTVTSMYGASTLPGVASVAGRTGAVTLTSSDVGLGNVTNTSDANKPVSTAQQTQLDAKVTRALTKRAVTANYTLVAADATDIVLHSTAASAITITVPQDSAATIAQEVSIPWRQYGAGQLTFAAGTGATLLSRGSVFRSAAQYAEGMLTKTAANTWLLTGDIVT